MKLFAELYRKLDETTRTNEKIKAIADYLKIAPPEDAVWAINFLIGRRPKQLIKSNKLWTWSIEKAGISEWLFVECYEAVGDIAETITLLLKPSGKISSLKLSEVVDQRLFNLKELNDDEQKNLIFETWDSMDQQQRFVWNKLVTGGFRVGVSQSLIVKGISQFSGIEEPVIAHRLMGNWKPDNAFYHYLVSTETGDADISKPYPFYLAYQLDDEPEKLGDLKDWLVEWKWDGIRCQLIKRNSEIFLWSRGEELITDRFPEITLSANSLPDGIVIDGEILAWCDNKPLIFGELQKRIGRKNVSKKILTEIPAVLLAFDLIEHEGKDIRDVELKHRRKLLKEIIDEVNHTAGSSSIILSEKVDASSWKDLKELRSESRARCVEGFVLKKSDSPYETGRRRGKWWKWKIDPYTIDAVLIYAQRGHGRRASLYTDYTFGIWDNGRLVTFAKAYSGLTDEEIRKVDSFVRRNTLEKFGPVRTVKPELVFEIAFEGIRESSRHKSGVAVRFPRISRWRTDKKIEDADTLEGVKNLLKMNNER
jgi:DNA ligase-1